MEEIELIAFDVDGVLVDVAESYPEAIRRTAAQFLGPDRDGWISDREMAALKRAGGFNSDWDLAAATIWAQGAGRQNLVDLAEQIAAHGGGLEGVRRVLGEAPSPPYSEVEQAACEIYAGTARIVEMYGMEPSLDTPQEGVWQCEKALVESAELLLLPIPKAIYSGRTTGELAAVLDRFGLVPHFPENLRLTCDGPYRKPDGRGLVYLARAAGARSVLMVGDNVDDHEAAVRAQGLDPSRRYRFCGILGGALGENAREVFAERGVEAFASSTAELLRWLRGA